MSASERLAPEFETSRNPYEGWIRLRGLTPEMYAAMWESYKTALPDQTDWVQFAMNISSAFVLVGDEGWLKFDNLIPNASIEFHGAKWEWIKGCVDPLPIRSALRAVMDDLGVHCVLAKIPDRARAARLCAVRLGFKPCGVIPNALTYGGLPVDVHVHVLRPEDL